MVVLLVHCTPQYLQWPVYIVYIFFIEKWIDLFFIDFFYLQLVNEDVFSDLLVSGGVINCSLNLTSGVLKSLIGV